MPPDHTALTRRTVVKSLALAPLASLLPLGCGRGGPEEPPDIIFLVADTLRARSLPILGYPRQTAPFLTDLAGRATLFTRCYSSATWTRPAVTGILSGLTPLEHRQWEFQKAFPPEVPSFPKILGERGYQTGFFTANHAIGEGYGMEEHFDHVDFGAALDNDFGHRLTRDAVRWLERSTEAPVFAYVHYFPPHGPYDPPAEFVARAAEMAAAPGARHELDRRLTVSLGNASMGRIPWYQALPHFSDEVRRYVDLYDASVLYADSLLAGFFEAWRRLGRMRRTVFVITSDHGECLWEHDHWFDHGRMLADEILHVPLLVFDSDDPRRRRVEQPVSHLDLGVTIVRLAGVEEDGRIRGADVLEPGRARTERVLLSQEPVAGQESGWSLVRGRWRLVYNDCPRDGLAPVMAVTAGEPRMPNRRVTLSRDGATGRRDLRVSPGVIVDAAFADPPHPTGDDDARVEVRLRVEPRTGGRLALRWSGAPDEVAVESFERSTGAATKSLRVPLPPRRATSSNLPDPLTLQASWRGEGRDEDRSWIDIASLHRLGRWSLAEGIDLLGVLTSPPVATPGADVRMSYAWEVSEMPSPHVTVHTQIRGPGGEEVLEWRHRFYGTDPDERTPKPLIEKWRLRTYDFEGKRFRFEESYWVGLPDSLDAGEYGVEVGLTRTQARSGTWETPSPASYRTVGKLAVAPDSAEVLRRTVELGYGAEGCPALWKLGQSGEAPADPGRFGETADALASQYPEEGHLDFLRWSAGLPGAAGGLTRCLEKVPLHVGALRAAEAAGVDDVRGRRALSSLTPPRSCDFRFGHVARLYGFRLERSPERGGQVYLGLYWEALSSTPIALAAECSTSATGADGTPARSSSWWFIGGTRRPSPDWKIGEAIVETIRLPMVKSDSTDVRISLRVTERWELIYSDNRHSVVLPAREDGVPDAFADVVLGSFRLADLPVAEKDHLAFRRRDPDFLRLHDLAAAEPGAVNLVVEEPEVTADLLDALEVLLREAERQEAVGEGEEGEPLSEEERKKLRALGYIA